MENIDLTGEEKESTNSGKCYEAAEASGKCKNIHVEYTPRSDVEKSTDTDPSNFGTCRCLGKEHDKCDYTVYDEKTLYFNCGTKCVFDEAHKCEYEDWAKGDKQPSGVQPKTSIGCLKHCQDMSKLQNKKGCCQWHQKGGRCRFLSKFHGQSYEKKEANNPDKWVMSIAGQCANE
jgi:hypothetical protein